MNSPQNVLSMIHSTWDDNPVFYLKFCSKREYAEDVLAGKLYANTPLYFRELEAKYKKRGQGDINDVALRFRTFNLTFHTQGCTTPILTIPSCTVQFSYKADDLLPMVSFLGITLSDLTFVTANERSATFRLSHNADELKTIEDHLGKYCVLIDAKELNDHIRQACQHNNILYNFAPEIYAPKDSSEKKDAFANKKIERLSFKDLDLSYQHEYRLALNTAMPEDHYIHIGKLTNAFLLEVNHLGTMELSIELKELEEAPEN